MFLLEQKTCTALEKTSSLACSAQTTASISEAESETTTTSNTTTSDSKSDDADSDSDLHWDSDMLSLFDVDMTASSSDSGDSEFELNIPHFAFPDFSMLDDEESSSDESSTGSEDESDMDSGDEADDEGDTADVTFALPPRKLFRRACHAIKEEYTKRYQKSRGDMPRGPAYLPYVLTVLKEHRPDLFRIELRVSPSTFVVSYADLI